MIVRSQSIVFYVFCKTLRKKLMWYDLKASWELQWRNALKIFYFSLHGQNGPYTPFFSKVGFPSDSYICMLTEPPTL